MVINSAGFTTGETFKSINGGELSCCLLCTSCRGSHEQHTCFLSIMPPLAALNLFGLKLTASPAPPGERNWSVSDGQRFLKRFEVRPRMQCGTVVELLLLSSVRIVSDKSLLVNNTHHYQDGMVVPNIGAAGPGRGLTLLSSHGDSAAAAAAAGRGAGGRSVGGRGGRGRGGRTQQRYAPY